MTVLRDNVSALDVAVETCKTAEAELVREWETAEIVLRGINSVLSGQGGDLGASMWARAADDSQPPATEGAKVANLVAEARAWQDIARTKEGELALLENAVATVTQDLENEREANQRLHDKACALFWTEFFIGGGERERGGVCACEHLVLPSTTFACLSRSSPR